MYWDSMYKKENPVELIGLSCYERPELSRDQNFSLPV